MKHAELNKKKFPKKEQPKPKESEQNQRTEKQKANIEQLVNAVKEGLKSQKDFL